MNQDRERTLMMLEDGDVDAAKQVVRDAVRDGDRELCKRALAVLGHARSVTPFFELEALLAREPSHGAWRRIVKNLLGWPPKEGLFFAVDYAEERLAEWPSALRLASWAWWYDLERGGRHATLWRLARSLSLEGTRLTVSVFRRLAETPELSWLEHLSIEASNSGAPAMSAFFSSSYLTALKTLGLSFNALGPEAISIIAASGAAPRLERLDVSNNPVGDIGVDRLLEWRETPFPRQLVLTHGEIGNNGAIALSGQSELRALDLSCNQVTDAGVGSLLSGSLTRLSLANNAIGDGALAAMKSQSGLRELDLSHTRVTDRGLELVIRRMPQLESLAVAGTAITRKAAVAAAKRASLDELVLPSGSVWHSGQHRRIGGIALD